MRPSDSQSTPDATAIEWRLVKIWDGEEAQWVLQIQAREPALRKSLGKRYLVIDGRPASTDVSLVAEKPERLRSAGATGLLRKHLGQCGIGPVMIDPDSKDQWLPLYNKGDQPSYFILRRAARPPVLELVKADGTAIIRRSHKGLFTKPWQRDVPWPWPDSYRLREETRPQAVATETTPQEDVETDALDDAPPPDESDANTVLPPDQRQLRDQIARRLKTARKGLSKLEHQADQASGGLDLADQAKLLQSHLHRVQPGMIELTLTAAETGLDYDATIPLDPDASPGEQLDKLFIQVKKHRRARSMLPDQLAKARKNISELVADLASLRAEPLAPAELARIRQQHGLSAPPKRNAAVKDAAPDPFRRYEDHEGIQYLVGKGARQNDELTKRAQGNDLWVHTIAVAGSHVVVPARFLRNRERQTIARRAAMLAIHFSKLRQDRAGDVYVAWKRDLRKPKGLVPGLWLVDRSESLFVRYDDSELRQLLDGPAQP